MFATLSSTGGGAGALQVQTRNLNPDLFQLRYLDNVMARRTKMEAAATREKLLDAAAGVFREHGVAHSTLAEVAAAAGMTRGAVYWHFRDKAHLFDALCEREQLPMEAMLACAGEVRQK